MGTNSQSTPLIFIADWDMAGNHDLGPLFSGHQADHMQLFDASKIVRRRLSPTIPPGPETFEIVAHGAAEDATGRINLLELKVTDSLSYYVEVRQKPGAVIFDAKIPIPAGASGRVLVTRVDEAQTISNTPSAPPGSSRSQAMHRVASAPMCTCPLGAMMCRSSPRQRLKRPKQKAMCVASMCRAKC